MKKKNAVRYFTLFKGVRLPVILILLSTLFSVGMAFAELQTATMTGEIIDASQKAIDTAMLLNYIGIVALTAALDIYSNYFTRKMEEVVTLRVRVKLWKKIMHLPSR